MPTRRKFERKPWLIICGGLLVVLLVAWVSTGCSTEAKETFEEIKFDSNADESISWSDMSFADLKEKAQIVNFENLINNFDRYSLRAWMDKGGPVDSIPPVLYFKGELVDSTDTEFVLWKGLLQLEDGNDMVLNVTKIVDKLFPVGAHLEALVVCQKMVMVESELLPQCLPHKLREIN